MAELLLSMRRDGFLNSKESDSRDRSEQDDDNQPKTELGLRNILAVVVALLETIAIPLLVLIVVLVVIVFLAFR